MWRSCEQDPVAAVNFAESIFRRASEMECITCAQKDVLWEFFEHIASAPDHDIVQRKPMPYSGTLVVLELAPDVPGVLN
jgi:hypothetical protein